MSSLEKVYRYEHPESHMGPYNHFFIEVVTDARTALDAMYDQHGAEGDGQHPNWRQEGLDQFGTHWLDMEDSPYLSGCTSRKALHD